MSQETTPAPSPQQGLTANAQLKAAFDKEVEAVEALLKEHDLVGDFTPIWSDLHPANIIYAAPAIAIARLVSGYRVDTVERVFNYALFNLKFNTRVNDIKIQGAASQDALSAE